MDPKAAAHLQVDVLATLQKLPPKVFIKNEHNGLFSTDAPVVCIKRGERGYYPIYTSLTAEELNKEHNPDEFQIEAMHLGSLCGWEVPGADPDYHRKAVQNAQAN
jgi:hypothetical protein